jgi:hypothetical protein
MLDMLGEDARAAVGKVKQLQSQGATPDQVQAQMIEAARNGLLPISVAFAAQKALQRKNPPPPPAQGTVMSDMLSQLQQSQNPREQGIAGLENPVMDNAQYAGGGIVAFAEAGAVSGIKTYTDPKTGEMYRLDSKGNRVKLTPNEVRRLQIENDQRGLKRGIGSMGILPATAYDMVANPLNVTLGGIETAANAVGAARAGRMVGIYDPDVTHVTMPRIGDGNANPGQRAVDEMIANSGPTDVIPTETTPASKAAAAKTGAAETDAAGVTTLDPTKIQSYLNAGSTASRDDGGAGLAGLRAPRINTSAYDTAMNAAIAQSGPTAEETAAAEQTRDELGQEEVARYERLGIGAGREKQREKLGKKRTELEADRKRSKLEEIGLGFLTEGVAAASRGESTLGSLASGFGAGLKGAKLSKEKLDAASDKLDEQEAALDQQKEALLLQGDANGLKRWEINQNAVKDARKVVTGLQLQKASTHLGIDQFNISNEFKIELARLQVAASKSKLEKATDPLFGAALAALKQNDISSYNYFKNRIAELTSAGAAGVQTEALRQQGKAAETQALTNPTGAQAGNSSVRSQADAILNGGS